MTQAVKTEENEHKSDGRKKRTDQSRQKIVLAFLQLVRDGNVTPSAEDVAKQAKVGLRTIFRRFNEMELLYREMITEIQGQFAPEVVKPWKTEGLKNQLQELLERKAKIYEALMPYRIAANYHKYNSDFIKQGGEHWIEIERKVLANLLPFSVSTEPVLFKAIEVSLSFETWIQLRIDHDADAFQTYEIMKLNLSALLATYDW